MLNVSPLMAHMGKANARPLRRPRRRWVVTEETVIVFSQLLLLKWFLVWIWPFLTWLVHLPP